MALVKMRIIANKKDNEELIELFSKLFNIVPDFIEGPLPNKKITVSFLTFNFEKLNLDVGSTQ